MQDDGLDRFQRLMEERELAIMQMILAKADMLRLGIREDLEALDVPECVRQEFGRLC